MPTTSKYGPEIHELCLKWYTEERLSYATIAQRLMDEHGVVARKSKKNPDAPDRPVDKATILRWLDKASGNVEEARTRRQRVEEHLAAVDLDEARKVAYEILLLDEPKEVEAKVKALDGFLKVRDARSRTYGTYAPKRKDIAVTSTETGGVPRRDLDPKREKNVAGFQGWVKTQNNGARPAEEVDRP